MNLRFEMIFARGGMVHRGGMLPDGDGVELDR